MFVRGILVVLVVLCLFSVVFAGVSTTAPPIVVDEFGNEVGLPMMGGVATGGFSLNDGLMPLTPYNLTVFVNNLAVNYEGSVTRQSSSFYVIPSFGSASLIGVYFQGGEYNPALNSITYSAPWEKSGVSLGAPESPNSLVGQYVYEFEIPTGAQLTFNLVYTNQFNPTITDYILINVVNTK